MKQTKNSRLEPTIERANRLHLVGLLLLTTLVTVLALPGVAATCVSPPSSLAGWWPGEGNANDIASANNGSLQGGATAAGPGYVGTAFTFDGTNSYVQIPDSPAFHPANLTIEAWVLFNSLDSAGSGDSPAGQQYIVFKQNSRTATFDGFNLGKSRSGSSDYFVFGVSSSAGEAVEIQSTSTVVAGVWNHVAGVRGSNYIQIYVNGQMQNQATVSFAQDYGTLPLFFGTTGQAWDHKFSGSLDEVSLYDRALSSEEIAGIYAADVAGKCKAGNPPTISAQPQSQSVAVGTNVSFTVTASGDAPLSYERYFNGGSLGYPGAETLTLFDVQPPQEGEYVLIVTNFAGSATSLVATLTVVVPPDIYIQPADVTAVLGSTVGFGVAASGTPPLLYQWQFNGTNLPGANGDSITITHVQPSDAGPYRVLVSNDAGSILSAFATLTVVGHPALTDTHLTPDGHLAFTLRGDAGQSYVIQVSSDLMNWNDLTTVDLTSNQIVFTDPSLARSTARFYRAQLFTSGGGF